MQVLDRAHFDHMTGADRALQLEILDLFKGQVAGWRAAFAAEQDWRTAVHTAKGSARGIGLNALAAACEAAEVDGDLTRVSAALEEALVALEQFAAEPA